MQTAHLSALEAKHATLDQRIADESHRPLPDVGVQVHVEDVGGGDLDVRRHRPSQIRREVAVDLDGGDGGRPRRQARRQNTWAGTDLQETVPRVRRDHFNDFVRPASHQKVLPEPLARPGGIQSRSIDSPRQNFSSIPSISSSLIPK